MKKARLFLVAILVVLLSMPPLFSVGAAGSIEGINPAETITGTVESVVVETDPVTNVTTVLVTYQMENGKSVTVRLAVETAVTLGLVQTESQEVQVVTTEDQMLGQAVQLDPATIIIDEGGSPLPVDVQITGTIQALEVQVDGITEVTTVLVTVLDGQGIATSYRISPEAAAGLGLALVETQTLEVVTPDESMIGQPIVLDPADILEEVETGNPIAQLLGDFFASLFGVDPAVIGDYHEQGMGFGVIAQAGIMSYSMDGDGTMMQTIMDAKLSGDFSTVVLPDGSTAENWGQLRQSIMKQDNALKNLGNIVSGHADELVAEPAPESTDVPTDVPTEPTDGVDTTLLQPDNQVKPGNGNSDKNGSGGSNDQGNSNAPGQNKPPEKTNNGKGHNK